MSDHVFLVSIVMFFVNHMIVYYRINYAHVFDTGDVCLHTVPSYTRLIMSQFAVARFVAPCNLHHTNHAHGVALCSSVVAHVNISVT